MGSGYFETGEDAEAGVLQQFVQSLSSARTITRSCDVYVVLNPLACQGLAAQSRTLNDLGWTLLSPFRQDRPGVKLHAKFIFAAGGDHQCRNPWCYIGSGNLSGTGFTRSARQNGNLEAVKLLLARGADVNAVSGPPSQPVKNGVINLGRLTPLMLAATGSADVVKALIAA